MFLLSNRNVDLCTRDGDETFTVSRGFIGEIPDRFCHTPYDALVKDGKIVLSATAKDKDIVKAAEEGEEILKETVKRTRKPKQEKE